MNEQTIVMYLGVLEQALQRLRPAGQADWYDQTYLKFDQIALACTEDPQKLAATDVRRRERALIVLEKAHQHNVQVQIANLGNPALEAGVMLGLLLAVY